MISSFGMLLRIARLISLVLFAMWGSTILMRYAPGYFTDSREMDAQHAGAARTELQRLQSAQAFPARLLLQQSRAWLHGDMGRSRQYDMPVTALVQARYRPTVHLLCSGMGLGWLMAIAVAVPLSSRRHAATELLVQMAVAILLAVPVGVLATASLLMNKGGPVFTLAILVAVREFKLLHSLLRAGWRTPQLFQARAQGFSALQALRVHLLPELRPELFNMVGMSAVIALSALVPVEVIFDVPGLGQLAWAAALNRDLPVLLVITALMALAVGFVALLTQQRTGAGAESLCE